MQILFEDFETRSPIDLGDVGAWRYASYPLTDVSVYCYAVNDGPVQVWLRGMPPPKPIFEAAASFNAGFERIIRMQIMTPRYGWPPIPLSQYRCLQASALSLAFPASLENVAAALGLKHQKDKAGAVLMRKWMEPRNPRRGENPDGTYWHDDPAEYTRLIEYCKADVLAERELYHRIGFLPPEEQKLWELDQKINDYGV
jgi:DNA polymerase